MEVTAFAFDSLWWPVPDMTGSTGKGRTLGRRQSFVQYLLYYYQLLSIAFPTIQLGVGGPNTANLTVVSLLRSRALENV